MMEWLPEIISLRRDIHKHPELGFDEHRTSKIVARILRELGYEVHYGLAKTGVVGSLTIGNSKKSIALRADMDALLIKENNAFEHCSIHSGIMHACGHDGHTAMLLGAARYLTETRNFDGTVHLIFQPAEEGLGGAKTMIEEGLFEKFSIDAIYGMHNWPDMPVGYFGVCSGPMLASYVTFDITVSGKGGHAAQPHQTSDPIVAASILINQLQTLVSRNVKPTEAAVVSVTQINAGQAYNVIPDHVDLKGSMRTLHPEIQALLKKRIIDMITGVQISTEVKIDITFNEVMPVLINSDYETEQAVLAATDIVGKENVDGNIVATMGSEDFSFMLQKKQGCYILMGSGERGAGEEKKILHNPAYDFNDDAIKWGILFWNKLVEQALLKSNKE